MNPKTAAGPVVVSGARNEWTSFCFQVDGLTASEYAKPAELRMGSLSTIAGATIGVSNISGNWVMPVAINTQQASLVRQAGPAALRSNWPAALVPIPMVNGVARLVPSRTFVPGATPGDMTASTDWIWIDLHIPTDARAGDYQGTCQLAWGGNVIQSIAVNLTVYDFALDDMPGLIMSGRIDWSDLRRLFPDQFASLTPAWLSRSEPRYADAVRLLDQMQSIAQANRLQIVVPRLQPIAKWSQGQSPQLDWSGFDDLVGPWLNGAGASSKIPVRCWPVPKIDNLNLFDAPTQRDYTKAALSHFDQERWLDQAVIEPDYAEPSDPAPRAKPDDADVCRAAAAVLAISPRARVLVPIEQSRLVFQTDDDPTLLDPATADRIVSVSPGLLAMRPDPPTTEATSAAALLSPSTASTSSPTTTPGAAPVHHWLVAGADSSFDLGASGADDARLWGSLAYLRQAGLVRFDPCLPATNDSQSPADPDALPWFYPGSWFGLDQPVATVRVKWLRRAEQDYEYLALADQRGISPTAHLLARLLAKPVELAKDQPPDATYGLVCGTVDSATWEQARDFLGRDIQLHGTSAVDGMVVPDPAAAQRALDIDLSRWRASHERPYIIARSVQWRPGPDDEFDADIGLDVYNASDTLTGNNAMQWVAAPPLWELPQAALAVGPLDGYAVRRLDLTAQVKTKNLPAALAMPQYPITVAFTNGYTLHHTNCSLVVPVAHCDRRPAPPRIDGQLDDWNMADAIQNGPMVRLLDRVSVQSGTLPVAPRSSQICTNWTTDEFLVAFKLADVDSSDAQPIRNFVQYQQRRAWGEDLCELLVQAQWPDGSTSPAFHIVAKPRGAVWVERQLDGPTPADDWTAIDSSVRYAATLHNGDWRGELAIPWPLLCPGHKETPIALRFNFVQHLAQTGESDSWAGPIDFGRDDRFMGLLVLGSAAAPGMNGGH